jgi:hypothetical protein
MSIRTLVEEHLKEVNAQVGGGLERALLNFADWVEGKGKKIAEAKALLEANGYSVAPVPASDSPALSGATATPLPVPATLIPATLIPTLNPVADAPQAIPVAPVVPAATEEKSTT